jgi:hypothetical protein
MAIYERLANSPTQLFIAEQARLKQFHHISDQALFKLAERASGFAVEDRWIAIALIMRNPIPVPVVTPQTTACAAKEEETTAAPQLMVIDGGKRAARAKVAVSGRS